MTSDFRPGDYVRLARRKLDMSQREFAAHLGLSASKVARAELDDGDVGLRVFTGVLASAGWRLHVVDHAGEVVAPAETLRDRGGRRFPAHLDVRAAGRSWWGVDWPSRMLDVPEHTFDLSRSMRDLRRHDEFCERDPTHSHDACNSRWHHP